MSRHTDQMAWADQTEQRVLDAALTLSDAGWGGDLASRAGATMGLSGAEVALLLPNGSRDLAALLSRRCDGAAIEALANTDPKTLKVRERIRTGVIARLDAHREYQPAARSCMGFLALPSNLPLAGRLLWEAADTIWLWVWRKIRRSSGARSAMSAIKRRPMAISKSSERPIVTDRPA